ncbi:polysaccharide deacetylase family protein [Lachnospiraceae bacterium SGI.085]|nr:polysaccharide deacetylase family protein [Roseburia porci]
MEQSENTGTQEYTEPLKKVALTFDDGPNPIYTPELLDGLEKRNVKATFFLLGEAVEDYPDIAKRIYEDGHLIGNHTYDHVNLGNLCENAACEQVRKTNEIIERVTGYYPEYVRPPFGEWKENIDNDVTMIKVLWNVDPLDWATGNADAVVERVVGKCEDNDIILMHDASESSVKAALRIIDILTKKGYEFVTVDQLILD